MKEPENTCLSHFTAAFEFLEEDWLEILLSSVIAYDIEMNFDILTLELCHLEASKIISL